jgi:hypothetical protein
MKANKTKDALNLLNSNPPCAIGLSRKSPNTAPKGLVRTKANQNNKVLEILV